MEIQQKISDFRDINGLSGYYPTGFLGLAHGCLLPHSSSSVWCSGQKIIAPPAGYARNWGTPADKITFELLL